jgi:hypothetical protein
MEPQILNLLDLYVQRVVYLSSRSSRLLWYKCLRTLETAASLHKPLYIVEPYTDPWARARVLGAHESVQDAMPKHGSPLYTACR